jgi:hypothetical protein
MMEVIEIRNETKKPIWASACRSKLSGNLYVHVGKCHGKEVKVEATYYAVIEVREVEA